MSLRPMLDLLTSGGRLRGVSVLIFHRVHGAVDPLFPGQPDRDSFDRQMGWLKRGFAVLPLAEVVAGLRRGTLPARPAAITFDDGYADNHDVALDILRRHGLPATFFVATGFLDGGCMWNDMVIEAVRHARDRMLDLRPLDLGLVPLATVEERRLAIAGLLGRLKYLPDAQRLRSAQAVAACAGVDLPDGLMMSSANVRALAEAGMTIGAHTVSHPILTTLSDDLALAEMVGSKQRLEAITARPVRFFAYPNGIPGRDYEQRHVALARQAGFEAAVSTAWGAARAGCDLYQIPRSTPWGKGLTRNALLLAQNMTRAAYAQA